MSDPDFFQTRMGHAFYNGTMPRIAKALEKIAEQLAELVDVLKQRPPAPPKEHP